MLILSHIDYFFSHNFSVYLLCVVFNICVKVHTPLQPSTTFPSPSTVTFVSFITHKLSFHSCFCLPSKQLLNFPPSILSGSPPLCLSDLPLWALSSPSPLMWICCFQTPESVISVFTDLFTCVFSWSDFFLSSFSFFFATVWFKSS